MVELPSNEQILEHSIDDMHGIRVVEMLQEPMEGLLSRDVLLKVSNGVRFALPYFLKKDGEVMFQGDLFEDGVPVILIHLLINFNAYSL